MRLISVGSVWRSLFGGGRLRFMDAVPLFCEPSACLNYSLLLVVRFLSNAVLTIFFQLFFGTFFYFSARPWKLTKTFMQAVDLSLRATNVSSLWHKFAKSGKLHAAAFSRRSLKPRLGSYWEAAWLIRRRLVQSGRSVETEGKVGRDLFFPSVFGGGVVLFYLSTSRRALR